ncbi:MAG: hypothetical protein IANPNBLG_03805 [Bryobacteraceae bacterium]|nr:hypothetical protein [Bryobacteraceae bacterium]
MDVYAPRKLEAIRKKLETMLPRVKTVIEQTRERVFAGNARFPGKLLSIFEPLTEIIRRGKADKPNEFGKMINVQEAEGQIVIDYDLQVPAVEVHQRQLGRKWWRRMRGSIRPRARRRWLKRE